MQLITATAVLGNLESEEEFNEWDITTTVQHIHTETFADILVVTLTDIILIDIQLIDILIVIIQLQCHFLSIFLAKSKFEYKDQLNIDNVF